MIKNRIGFFILLFIFFSNFLFAQQRSVWSRIDESDVNVALMGSKVKVKKQKSFALKLTDFKNLTLIQHGLNLMMQKIMNV